MGVLLGAKNFKQFSEYATRETIAYVGGVTQFEKIIFNSSKYLPSVYICFYCAAYCVVGQC